MDEANRNYFQALLGAIAETIFGLVLKEVWKEGLRVILAARAGKEWIC